jgi:hypothetical protein
MKPQGLVTMKISEATPNQYTILILMAAGHQKIGRKILKHLHRKDIREILTKDPHKVAKEVEQRNTTEAVAEGLTHSSLRTTCIASAQPTTTPKIVPSIW